MTDVSIITPLVNWVTTTKGIWGEGVGVTGGTGPYDM